MSKKKIFKWIAIIGIIIFFSISLGTIGHMYNEVKLFDEIFTQNVYIEDLAVGGLTKASAKEQLEKNMLEKLNSKELILTKDNKKVSFPLNTLGITYNIDEVINRAFEIGHNENFFKKYTYAKEGLDKEQRLTLTHTINKEKVKEELVKHSETFYIKPINASFTRKNHQFIITNEKDGESLDVEKTLTEVLDAVKELSTSQLTELEIKASITPVLAKYRAEVFRNSQTLLSSFSTAYNNSDANRNQNLKVAANKINQMILPDEEFFLSNQLEPFTIEEGYRDAATIVNGKIEDSLGGGICQVASTLYNSVLLTELDVTRRQNHSLAVSYVPLGRDATYNTGTIDFKFKNNSGYPIYIEGYCQNNQVVVNIYGHHSFKPKYDIKFESQVTEVIPAPATKYVEDNTLAAGKESVEVRAIDGKRVNLYKLYYQNGKLVKKTLANKSYYRPRAAVIRKGTKKIIPDPLVPKDDALMSKPEKPEGVTPPEQNPEQKPEQNPEQKPEQKPETPSQNPPQEIITPSTEVDNTNSLS